MRDLKSLFFLCLKNYYFKFFNSLFLIDKMEKREKNEKNETKIKKHIFVYENGVNIFSNNY